MFDAGTQGLNRYSYALNNPIRYNDPSGHGVVDSYLYGGWGQNVATSIQAGAASLKSLNDTMITGQSGTFHVAAYNSAVDLVAGMLSGIFSLGTGTGDWIADPTDYNKIPVLGPVGQNFGTSLGEAIMEPSVETVSRAVAASCQVVGTAAGGVQFARMVGPSVSTAPTAGGNIPSFNQLKDMAQNTLDFSSKPNGAVFWSGSGNMRVAQSFGKLTGKTTLEQTVGGQFLDNLNLFKNLPSHQATEIWDIASRRFASQVSGNSRVFRILAKPQGAYGLRTWWRIERPILKQRQAMGMIQKIREIRIPFIDPPN